MTDPDRPCMVVRPGEPFVGRQGLSYVAGLTGETAGSRHISMTVATLPPGARAKAHLHHGIETAAYVLEGRAEVRFGDRLQHTVVAVAGEYSFVPPDTPHVVWNTSNAVCRAVIAHTAADDQEGIVLLPELDELLAT
jgi:uncharacterized RmlC-like cupin family protein